MENLFKEELIKQSAHRVFDKAMSCVGTTGEVEVGLIQQMTHTLVKHMAKEIQFIEEDVFDRVIKLMGCECGLLIRVKGTKIYFVDKQKAADFDRENQ